MQAAHAALKTSNTFQVPVLRSVRMPNSDVGLNDETKRTIRRRPRNHAPCIATATPASRSLNPQSVSVRRLLHARELNLLVKSSTNSRCAVIT